jgi:methylenetetrahydrofolate reductase (NADPH)
MSTPSVSFEIFPPASLTTSFRLWDAIERLRGFAPDYVSVTYGAQGSAQDRTLDAAKAIMAQTKLPVAAHLTAARQSKSEVLARAESFAAAGITKIVALRGDPEETGTPFEPHPLGFRSSVDMIAALSKMGKFDITVGAHPESHPAAASMKQNIDFLKAKFDAGATEAITQFFFEADTFFRFRDACVAAGVTAPIIPGILPIPSWKKVRGFANKCGASVPAWLDDAFAKAIRDEREDLLSLSVASELCTDLVSGGADHLHIYTLNSAPLTQKLCIALGLAPKTQALRDVA